MEKFARLFLMKRLALLLVLLLGLAGVQLVRSRSASADESVSIALYDVQNRTVGTATLIDTNGSLMVELTIQGMNPVGGDRAVVLHEVADCTLPDYRQRIGARVEDLPPVQLYNNGSARYRRTVRDISLDALLDGDGSALVVHADVPPNAGDIIICGEITVGAGASPQTTWPPDEPTSAPISPPTEPEPPTQTPTQTPTSAPTPGEPEPTTSVMPSATARPTQTPWPWATATPAPYPPPIPTEGYPSPPTVPPYPPPLITVTPWRTPTPGSWPTITTTVYPPGPTVTPWITRTPWITAIPLYLPTVTRTPYATPWPTLTPDG